MMNTEDFVVYGTPAENNLEDEARPRKAPRVEDQVVLDKDGKRRFHGAFTGGFSAGYFNSVASKEGWTPSTFVSSRSQKNDSKEKHRQRPQDFMDDEDLEYFGIAPQKIRAKNDFDALQSTDKKRKYVSDGPIPGLPVLESILQPTKATIGMKLLGKLGWKPGQGIGPRVSLKEKKKALKKQAKSYRHSSLVNDRDKETESESEDETSLGESLNFAPADVNTEIIPTPKSNVFGIGYKPLDRTPVLGSHVNLFGPSPLSMIEKKKKLLIKGQAFGVGAFEEEDEDIYSQQDMSDYDFTLNEEKQKSSASSGNRSSKYPEMGFVGLMKALEGFELSSDKAYKSKVFPAPNLPSNYVAQHQSRKQRRFQQKENETKGLGRHELSAKDRSRILSVQPTTVHIEVKSGVKSDSSIKLSEECHANKQSIDTSEVDKIFAEFENTKAKFSTDFKPFAKDPEKQRRYDLYLKMKEKGHKDRFHLAQPKAMTEWEKQREVHEFDRAAQLFRPLISSMSSRFVTAKIDDGNTKLKEGLNAYDPGMSSDVKEDVTDVLGGSEIDDRMKASKVKLFGRMTQCSVEWHPDRLLCRRFNVPPPYADSSIVGVPKHKKNKESIFNILSTPLEDTAGLSQPKKSEEKDQVKDQEYNEEALVDGDLEKPETYGLAISIDGEPSKDLFKAIFCDSDEETKEEIDNESNNNTIPKEECQISNFISFMRNAEPTKDIDATSNSNLESTKDKDKRLNRNLKETSRNESLSSESTSTRSILNNDSTDNPIETNFKPSFIKRRKETEGKVSRWTKETSTSVFSGIDFNALNQYRNNKVEISNDDKSVNKETRNSDSSTDSDEKYGPAVPMHLASQNRLQMIRDSTTSVAPQFISSKTKDEDGKDKKWIERKVKKLKKHKDRHKSKKSKKDKKKHKEKHKKKSKKRSKSKYSSSSDSSSDTS